MPKCMFTHQIMLVITLSLNSHPGWQMCHPINAFKLAHAVDLFSISDSVQSCEKLNPACLVVKSCLRAGGGKAQEALPRQYLFQHPLCGFHLNSTPRPLSLSLSPGPCPRAAVHPPGCAVTCELWPASEARLPSNPPPPPPDPLADFRGEKNTSRRVALCHQSRPGGALRCECRHQPTISDIQMLKTKIDRVRCCILIDYLSNERPHVTSQSTVTLF